MLNNKNNKFQLGGSRRRRKSFWPVRQDDESFCFFVSKVLGKQGDYKSGRGAPCRAARINSGG